MSKILGNVHEMARALRDGGVIDGVTMRRFDVHLGVAASTVRQWEQGAKHPRGPSTKLLDLIERKGIETLS